MEFDNLAIKDYLNKHNLSVIKADPQRPWGGWYIIDIDNIENPLYSMYDKKVLRVIPGTLLSLQYHGSLSHPGHHEIWEALTKIRAIISQKSAIGLSRADFDDCM